MNLHEQCLLKYLQNPDELTYSTEALIQNNLILEEQFIINVVAKYSDINYTNKYA
jgi:hypothetical protein